jgi:hypothetical protein
VINEVKRKLKTMIKRLLPNLKRSFLPAFSQQQPKIVAKPRNTQFSLADIENTTLTLVFSRPGTHFTDGDDLYVSVFNPLDLDLDLKVILTRTDGSKAHHTKKWDKNPISLPFIKDFTGQFTIVAVVGGHANTKSNSIRGHVLADTPENQSRVDQNRQSDHRLRSAVSANAKGALTLIDPWITPGGAANLTDAKWFPTPVFEGATTLYNETSYYYRDPLKYFLDQIDHFVDAGFEFITWHSIVDGAVKSPEKSILLQFDVDAGPNSFVRIGKALQARNIAATVMIHSKARHWYDYDLNTTDIAALKSLEASGWTIGYHNNALTTLAGYDQNKARDPNVIAQATDLMHDEISTLRNHFDIRTLTHHGGNVYNSSVPIPNDAGVICVDRPFNQNVWCDVKSSFSDGSFTARPEALADWVNSARVKPGIHFMRCHPLKYGNFPDGCDVGPLSCGKSELPEMAVVKGKVDENQLLSPIERQVVWQDMRMQTRKAQPLSELSANMPISSGFTTDAATYQTINAFRAKRHPGFIRLYPWVDGDPRVIWWHMITSYCTKGDVFNVGAMSPDQKDETMAFLQPGQSLLEVDIEPERAPDILANFCADDFQIETAYQNVFLDGLPYFSDPKQAINNSLKSMRSGGRLLVGAAGAAHPERGGWFRPKDRPVWRKGQSTKGGGSLSLLTTLWSFDRTSIEHLMEDWNGTWQAEAISDYWFIVADKE